MVSQVGMLVKYIWNNVVYSLHWIVKYSCFDMMHQSVLTHNNTYIFHSWLSLIMKKITFRAHLYFVKRLCVFCLYRLKFQICSGFGFDSLHCTCIYKIIKTYISLIFSLLIYLLISSLYLYCSMLISEFPTPSEKLTDKQLLFQQKKKKNKNYAFLWLHWYWKYRK